MKKLLILLLALAPTGALGQAFFTPTRSTAITIATATTTLLITGVTGKQVVVMAVDVLSSAAGTLQFIAGTDATCSTGSSNVTGNYSLAAGGFLQKGDGNGILWALPAGNSLCAVTTGAGLFPGSITWTLVP